MHQLDQSSKTCLREERLGQEESVWVDCVIRIDLVLRKIEKSRGFVHFCISNFYVYKKKSLYNSACIWRQEWNKIKALVFHHSHPQYSLFFSINIVVLNLYCLPPYQFRSSQLNRYTFNYIFNFTCKFDVISFHKLLIKP